MTTSTTIPIAHMQRLLERVAKREGFKEPRYSVAQGSKAGDNYLGVLFRVDVSEGDAAASTLHLILKGMPSSAKRREEMQVIIYFNNEMKMYRVVLPALARFLVDKGMDEVRDPSVFPYAPKCYDATSGGAEGEDVLVLEDMRPLGFIMIDRRVGQDVHHVRAVLRSLAYLHAASFAMEKQRPQDFASTCKASVQETIFKADNPILSALDAMVNRTYGYVKERYPEGSDGYERLKAFLDKYSSSMTDLTSPDPNGGNVISHGDCWTNNLLFKHNQAGTVEEACLLDFQLARYAPPVLDILYLMFSCTELALREEHFDSLLKEYHNNLSANLRCMGCDAEELYSWETMQRQLRERGKYGLGMAVMTVPLFLVDSDEVPDLDAQFESGTDMAELFDIDSKSAPERNRRICDVVQDTLQREWM